MANWSSLPKDIASKIAEHLNFYDDFESFRCICSSWRLAAKEANFRGGVDINSSADEHTLPWLLLTEKVKSRKSPSVRLYNPYKRMVRHVSLPDIMMVNKEIKRGRYGEKLLLFSSYGWLLRFSTLEQYSKYGYMLNPYTGKIIELPELKHPGTSLYPFAYPQGWFYEKLALSHNPSMTSDFVVFLHLKGGGKHFNSFFYWRNCDEEWTQVIKHEPFRSIDSSFLSYYCTDITFFQGEFYAVNCKGMVAKFETSQGGACFDIVAEFGYPPRSRDHKVDVEKWFYYFVKLTNRLLVVRKVVTFMHDLTHIIKSFEVYELDAMIVKGEIKEVRNLGNNAIFIEPNASFTVEASPAHGFKPNCIYYKLDGCVYNLTNGKTESFYDGPLSNNKPKGMPLMWVESPTSSNLS